MNTIRISRFIILGIVFAGLFAVPSAKAGWFWRPRPVVVVKPAPVVVARPAPVVVVKPRPVVVAPRPVVVVPARKRVWVEGHYVRHHRERVWIPGRWTYL